MSLNFVEEFVSHQYPKWKKINHLGEKIWIVASI